MTFFSKVGTFINIIDWNMYIEVAKKDGGFFTHGEITNYVISGNYLIISSNIAERKTMNKIFDLAEITFFKICKDENE